MSMNRRYFMGAVAGSLLGLVGSARALPPGLVERRREQIEDGLRKYGGPVDGNGFLDQPAFVVDDTLRAPQEAYAPQPGDIMFSRSAYAIFRMGHKLAGAGEPSHSAIVFRRPDGGLSVLEAGPFDVAIIETMDLIPYLTAYHNRGRVWIRRRVTPLTEEQSCRLSEAAMAQENKAFARWRLYSQVTPFRHRGPIRTQFIGKSSGIDNRAYFCSELVTECLIYSGLMREECTRPRATYPHELFFDDSTNPFLKKHYKLAPCWLPPSRWRPKLCAPGCQPEPAPDVAVPEVVAPAEAPAATPPPEAK